MVLAAFIRTSYFSKMEIGDTNIWFILWRYCLIWKESSLKKKSSRYSSFSQRHFRGLGGKGFPTDNRHSHGLMSLSYAAYFCTHTKHNLYSPCSRSVRKLAFQFNFTYIYFDDVLFLNNPDFDNYLGQMYPTELEIKDMTESNTSASYLYMLLSIITKLDLFPNVSVSNIPRYLLFT